MSNVSRVAIYAVLALLVLTTAFLAEGCGKYKSPPPANTQSSTPPGDTATQPALPAATPPPVSSGEKSGGMLQAGAGDRSGSQAGQSIITYGAYALWTGKWDTTFFRYGGKEHKTTWELKQSEIFVTGTYDWDSGRINMKQSKTSGLAIGTWAESPTYKPPDDAGDIELQQSQDGNSFTGKWRYGSSGEWIGEWNGRRIR